MPGPLEASLTLFGSNIDHALQLRDIAADKVALVNADGLTRTRGAELLLRYRWQAVTFTGSYVHTDASEPDPDGPGRRAVPLTPRDTAGLTAVWEKPGHARLGLEAYYTGRQHLENDPYRTDSKPYVELGAMGELVIGKASLFINAENLLSFRQTRYSPLLLPDARPMGHGRSMPGRRSPVPPSTAGAFSFRRVNLMQFRHRLADDLHAAQKAQAGQDCRDGDVGPSGSGAEHAQRCCHHSDIADGVVARADPDRLTVGVAIPVPPEQNAQATLASSAAIPTAPMVSAAGKVSVAAIQIVLPSTQIARRISDTPLAIAALARQRSANPATLRLIA
jgi:hypothetical protein